MIIVKPVKNLVGVFVVNVGKDIMTKFKVNILKNCLGCGIECKDSQFCSKDCKKKYISRGFLNG